MLIGYILERVNYKLLFFLYQALYNSTSGLIVLYVQLPMF